MARINGVSFCDNPSIESVCRIVRAVGFDSLEVSRPPFYEKLKTHGTRRRFAEWATEIGLSLYGFDCWVEVQPYSKFDETIQGFKEAIAWAADLNLGLIISHDPWGRDNGNRSPAECLKINIELFQRVADLCAAKKLRLVFEPHPDTLSMDNQWAIDFVDGLRRDSVGLLYDCCHYGVGQPKTYVESIQKLDHRIQHVHFSDGDQQTYALHLALGDGVIDLDSIVVALKVIGFRGTLTNDLFSNPLPEEASQRNIGKIRAVEDELGIV